MHHAVVASKRSCEERVIQSYSDAPRALIYSCARLEHQRAVGTPRALPDGAVKPSMRYLSQ